MRGCPIPGPARSGSTATSTRPQESTTSSQPRSRAPRTPLSASLNRQDHDFRDEERELLDLLRPHVAQAAAIAAQLSQPLPAVPLTADGKLLLTPRQNKIMQLVADGDSDRVISRRLDISTHTVHAHLRQVYHVLGVNSRTEAIARLRT